MILAIMGTAATSGSIPYWMGVTSGAGAKESWSLATDTNNLYVAGYSTPSNNEIQVYSMLKAGSVNWQRSLATASADRGFGIAVDSSGNVYATGYIGTGADEIMTVKYNSSGTLQWQRTLAETSGNSDRGEAIVLNSSADVYIAGNSSTVAGGANTQVAKYNTSGTLQWQRLLSNTSNNDKAFGAALDSTGDLYVAGYNQAALPAGLLAKWNASGTFQWQRTINASYDTFFYGACIDAAGALYAVGYNSDAGADQGAYIVKLATTPTLTWDRDLDSASQDIFFDVDTDSANNVYAVGRTVVSGVNRGLIAKYNSSGTLQWQRTISQAASINLYGVTVDSDDVLYVSGTSSISGVTQMFIARLPNDGTLTGSYTLGGVSHTYGASSLTGSTPGNTLSTSTLTASTSTLTDAAGTATDASTSITFTATNI